MGNNVTGSNTDQTRVRSQTTPSKTKSEPTKPNTASTAATPKKGPSANVLATKKQARSDFDDTGSGQRRALTGETAIEKTDPKGAFSLDGGKLPASPDELPLLFKDLKGKKKEDLGKIYEAMKALVAGTPAEKLKGLAELARQMPGSAQAVIKKLGITDPKLARIAGSEDALKALGGMIDGKASIAARTAAAIKFATTAGGVYKAEEMKGLVGDVFKGLPGAEKFATAVATFSDPNKSALEKVKAAVDVGQSAKEVAGKFAPELENDLRKADGSFRTIGAAMTLVDPRANPAEKALAIAQLAAELPSLKKDLAGLKQALQQYGVQDAEKIVDDGAKAAEVPVKGLNPALTEKLSDAEVQQLKTLSEKVGPEELEKVLKKVSDTDALGALTSKLSTLDAPAGKRLLTAINGMENSVLAASLKDAGSLESLAKLATRLDDDGAKLIGKMAKDMDHEGLKVLFKLTDGADAATLKIGLKGLAPGLEKSGGKLVGESLKVLDKALGKVGVKITEDVAAKIFKNLAKAVPLLGDVPNVIDAVKYGKEAIELRDKNPDLGFFAATAAGLNVADGVVSTALDLTGAGVPIEIGASVVFGAGELAMDLAFDAEKKKFLADPKNYQAPGWMKAVNIGAASLGGVGGIGALASYYGPEGTAQLVQWGAETSVKGATDLAKTAGIEEAEIAGGTMKLTAAAIHQLADVIRNPTKYTEAVRKNVMAAYDKVIEKGGQLADEAKQLLTDVVDKALAAGEKGFETVKFIAQHPGESAKIAVDKVKHLVSKGVDLTLGTGRALYKKGVETLHAIEAGYEKLKGAAKQKAQALITSAKQGITAAFDYAATQGQKGAELLAWAATHPGELAKRATHTLVSLMQQGGQVAKDAWNAVESSVRSGGQKVVAAAKEMVEALRNGGSQAVETLKWIAQNPTTALKSAGQWVGDSLVSIARHGANGAREAAQAVKDFVDRRVAWAQKFATEMLTQNVAAFKEVARAWGQNLTEGGRAVLESLRDLKDAGVDALEDLARYGGDLTSVATGYLGQMAAVGIQDAHVALETLQTFGGEVSSAASTAYGAVKSATSGEFTLRGYKFDLNPWW